MGQERLRNTDLDDISGHQVKANFHKIKKNFNEEANNLIKLKTAISTSYVFAIYLCNPIVLMFREREREREDISCNMKYKSSLIFLFL